MNGYFFVNIIIDLLILIKVMYNVNCVGFGFKDYCYVDYLLKKVIELVNEFVFLIIIMFGDELIFEIMCKMLSIILKL